MTITIPDAHCHLSLLSDPERAVEEAVAAGVSPILAVSMDADEAEAVLRLRDRLRPHVLAGAGLHPSRIVELTPDEQEEHLRRVEQLASEADFIGEIGLDWKDAREEPLQARQREALDRQLAAARTHGRPVNLHTRRADRELIEIAARFRAETGLDALIHWFTHSRKLARVCAEQGLFISAGPSILVSAEQAEVAAAIEATLLLVETDSPVEYGSLGSARPALAARVCSELAALRADPALHERLASNLARWRGVPRAR